MECSQTPCSDRGAALSTHHVTITPVVVDDPRRPGPGPRSQRDPDPPETHRRTVETLLDTAEEAGAFIFFGQTGVSIRVQTSLQKAPVSVAWFYPPDTPGWMRTRDLSFGCLLDGIGSAAASVREVAQAYNGWFESCGAGADVSSKGVKAWALTPDEATHRVADLSGEVKAIIRVPKSWPSTKG